MNSPVTMSNTINNPYPCHPNMFITENYSSKFTIKKNHWVQVNLKSFEKYKYPVC